MSTRELSAGELRYHLQELSVSVARRLVAVLDAARSAPSGVAAELNAVISEITDVQRDLAYEMAGPPLRGAADLSSLARMLELQRRMMRLMDRIETISSRPITNYLEQQQRAALTLTDQVGWAALPKPAPSVAHYEEPQPAEVVPAVRNWEQSHTVSPQPYEIVHQHAAYDAHVVGAGTAPFLAHSLGAGGSTGAAGAGRWPHFSPAARWGLLPMVICIVSALLTTTVNRLFQGDSASILQRADGVAKRGDRLDADHPVDEAAIAPKQPQALTSAPERRPEQVAVTAPVHPAKVIVTPPAPQSDRGLDALNPDAPSVAVLTTHQDPAVAQKTFAELKERYPTILGTAEAEIETIETQDGATWHRLSLLPPVPRSEAKDLCKRLRAAGYAGCWVRSRPNSE